MSDESGFTIKPRMTVDKVFTDSAYHPERRRVKFFPMATARDEKGQHVVVDMTDMAGSQYPIIWSRRVGDERLIVMLMDDEQGITGHGRLSEADFKKLPETEIEW